VKVKALTRADNKFQPLSTRYLKTCKVFEQLGFPIDLSKPIFPKKTNLDKETVNIIGTDNKKLIGIAPLHNTILKCIPGFNAKLSINWLTIQIIILLLEEEERRNRNLRFSFRLKDNVINMAGKIKFQQELQLISTLDVMLSMDSGNAHIAAMLG
jgi:ADP-heptose:LPS heptosyltransferase